jgi:uncharacterized Zn finger protein
MGLKIEEIICEDCGQEYEVKYVSKEPIIHCLFCGSETIQIEPQEDDLNKWYDDDEDLDEENDY